MAAQRRFRITKPSSSSSSSAKKQRTPFSDLSNNNFNIIPSTSTLPKLCPPPPPPSKPFHPAFPNPSPKTKSYSNLCPKNRVISSTQSNNCTQGSANSFESADANSIQSSKFSSSASAPKLSIPQAHTSTPPPVSSSYTPPGDQDPCKVDSWRQTAEKPKAKRKAAVVPSILPLQKLQVQEKDVTRPIICVPLPEITDKGKAIASPLGRGPSGKADSKQKAADIPLSFPDGKAKDKGQTIAILDSPKDERKAGFLAASCPLPRTRYAGNLTHEDRDAELSRSWTHSQPKRKKKCSEQPTDDAAQYALPKDFIERQRAYFKEVDEFELPEEEVSSDEPDKID